MLELIFLREFRFVQIVAFVEYTHPATFMTGKVYQRKCLSKWLKVENGKTTTILFTYQNLLTLQK